MTSKERVLAALSYRPVDVLPIFDSLWPEWLHMFRRAKGLPSPPPEPGRLADPWDEFGAWDRDACRYYGMDIRIASAVESPWPSGLRRLEPDGEYDRVIDSWGSVSRVRRGGYFVHTESPRMAPDDRNLDALRFEPPGLDARYAGFLETVRTESPYACVFTKVGGPFIRSTRIRGFEQWLVDLAADPAFATDLANRVADHLCEVGLESLRRANLYDTGIWIFDDIAGNLGTLFSPQTFERVFLPAYSRTVARFKGAGARHVLMHSDGDIRPVLPMLLEAGIEGINPVEYKAGMRVADLRKQYGHRLRFVGGIDNAHIMPKGSDAEFERHVREVVAVALEGGVVLGAHSIGPDVGVERYDHFHQLVRPGYDPPQRNAVLSSLRGAVR